MSKPNPAPLSAQRLPAFHLLIPAAGSGTRLGADIPKQYIKVNGKTILEHTIEKFYGIYDLLSLTVVVDETHLPQFKEATKRFEGIEYCIGRNSRKESIYNGLNNLSKVKNEDIILIHDAARPMVKRTDIKTLLQTINTSKAATLASAIPDTIIQNEDNLDRNTLSAIKTPQAFQYGLLKEAHERFKDKDDFTDDAGLVRAMGEKVTLVPCSPHNIKITTQDDLTLFEMLMMNNYETRTTMGFDVHAFETQNTDRKLMLGGIEIPHEYALTGHSDADVVLHAITDAILGAINKGDIGTLFPPSDPQWKDADSALFLNEASNLLNSNNGIINFVDVTVMAEAPKIGPHREVMQARIAEILSLDISRISIKATTTEKLGFIGRKEGMACQAVVTVQLPT